MKKLLLATLILSLTACSAYKPKKTVFYKNGQAVKTFTGYGVFDGNEWFGTYKIWAAGKGWSYYEYKCSDCTYVETEIVK